MTIRRRIEIKILVLLIIRTLYLKSKTVFYNIVEDLHIHNVGIYENNLVVIDYAGCEPVYEYDAKEGVVYVE